MPTSLIESIIYDPYDAYLDYIGNDRFGSERFNDKIKSLPEKFQDFVFNTRPGDFIKDNISLTLNLNEDQSRETAKIVMELIVADWYLGDAVNQIIQRVGVDEQKAKTIAGLIVTELFAPILEDLKKIHIDKFARNMSKTNPESADDRIINLKNQ